MKITAMIQARTNSSRFPKKVLEKINNKTIIEIIVERLKLSKKINEIIIAIPKGKQDDQLYNFIKKKNYQNFRGSEKNVLSRYYKAAVKYKADIIIRVTSDCPLIDFNIIDQMISSFIKLKKDYLSNFNPPTFPDGLDAELFTFNCLKKTYLLAKSKYDLEHVTPFMRNSGLFKIANFKNSEKNLSKLRWTLDEKEDLVVLKKIFFYFKPNILFGWKKIIKFINKNPKITEINNMFIRNKKKLDVSQKLWLDAKKIIPGGASLFSKRPDLHLPERWPTYYLKAKGCFIWTLDKKKLIDMSFMGVGTNILGYSHPLINKTVNKAILNSNISSLNCPEEITLAKKLIDIHPWAEKVKFARTGGEANSIAIRIARSASKKDNIAFCGYHGWHDWYLSANISNKRNLNVQLLPNLDIQGVPKKLKNTTFGFEYNNFKQLKEIISKHNIGIIKMEVIRNIKPKNNFLKKIRKIADQKKIILIFDECTSGFRETYGGIHKKYGVIPDIAIFGKALGNGHAITAVIGKEKIMNHAQNSFISSTFWTERSGIVAAIKTLDIMKKEKTWNTISKIGKSIKKKWLALGKKYNLKIKCSGMDSIVSFQIISENWLKYKTFITQEMLKKNILATNVVYVSTCHNRKIINKYFKYLNIIFKTISKCEKSNLIDDLLETPICEVGFKRLN